MNAYKIGLVRGEPNVEVFSRPDGSQVWQHKVSVQPVLAAAYIIADATGNMALGMSLACAFADKFISAKLCYPRALVHDQVVEWIEEHK